MSSDGRKLGARQQGQVGPGAGLFVLAGNIKNDVDQGVDRRRWLKIAGMNKDPAGKKIVDCPDLQQALPERLCQR